MKMKDVFERDPNEPIVVLIFRTADADATKWAAALLEEGKTYQIDKMWSYRFDQPHQPNQQQHTHFMQYGNEIAAINKDGTPSHSSNPDRIPKWVREVVRNKGLIENNLLSESAFGGIRVPPNVIAEIDHMIRYSMQISKGAKDK